MRCAYDINDDDTQRDALETLVAHTGKAEYWANLLKLSEHVEGLSDHQSLDLYRLKLLTGTMAGKDDYTLLAQLAIQLGFAGEGANVIQKAQAANLLTDARSNKLLALAKSQSGADMAGQAKAISAANAEPKGDTLVKIGEDQWGQGRYKDAIGTIQSGMKKNLADKDSAQIRLGMAYFGAGQKADAIKAPRQRQGPRRR